MGSPVMNGLLTSAMVYINIVIAIPYITLYFFTLNGMTTKVSNP
jgi:hypothetical protein